MNIIELSQRHVVFSDWKPFEDVQLNIHVIFAEHNTYIIDTGICLRQARFVHDYIIERKENKPWIVVITHAHYDHIMGLEVFENATIVAHQKCYDVLVNQWKELENSALQYVDDISRVVLPKLTFTDKLSFIEDKITCFTKPGHTDHDVCVYDEVEEVLNVGDNLGESDEYLLPSIKTTHKTLKASLEFFLSLEAKHIISGHNDVQCNEYISKMLEQIELENKV